VCVFGVTVLVRLSIANFRFKQLEAVPSTSDASDPSALQTEQCGSFRPQAPNLAGAVEFNDVKTLLKEWITTISGNGFRASDDVTCITGKAF